MDIQVFPDPTALARAAAGQFISLAGQAFARDRAFSVALAGGATPRALYALLASDEFSRRVDWSRVMIFFGDERCVPPGHPESNYGMARETFLDRVPLPPVNIAPIQGDLDPEEAACLYEHTLRNHFWDYSGFDLVLLGMGADGHTASLFPGSAAIHEQNYWVAPQYVESLSAWRITLTPVVINHASHVIFLVSGQNKAGTLGRVIQGRFQPDLYPSQIIRPTHGTLTWMLDSAAAELLTLQTSEI